MKIEILVAAHKEFSMPKKEGYLPVLVGAVKNYKPGISYQRDDDGENISSKNPNYNELTAVYWAWKNLKDVDAIGLVHYRRLLFEKRPYSLDNVISIEKVNQLLQKYDVILPKKRNYYIETNYLHYIHAHHKEPLEETRKIIQENHPKYLNAFDLVMKRRSAHMFNMFIMKKSEFEQYAEWLFSILFELEGNIDTSNYSTQEARVFGYISELLMDVWLESTSKVYVETQWMQMGKRHFFKKAFFLVGRKFGFLKETHF